MTGVDLELRAEEAERDNIQRMISALEAAHAVSSSASRSSIMLSLMNLQVRLANVEKRIEETEVDEKREKGEAVAVAIEREAEIEAKLNTDEKRTFSSFLREKFFTRADFGRLETFYAHTWDRLSEYGKDELSHRVWEGIRRDEYSFGELPEMVREKEAKRVYVSITKATDPDSGVSAVPEADRADFVRTYEAGKKDEAEQILQRDGFRNNLFRSTESKPVRSMQAEHRKEAEGSKIGTAISAAIAAIPSAPVEEGAKAKASLTDIELGDVKLVDAVAEPSSHSIPRSGASPARSTPSLSGS